MFISKNVRLFRPRDQGSPDIGQVHSALNNLGFTVIKGDLRRYKANLVPNPVLRSFVRNESIFLKLSSIIAGVVALSGGTLVTLGFMSGFDIPQLHEYRLGPMIGILFVISIIMHLMLEAVIENAPQWSIRKCDEKSIEYVQRQVQEIEQYSGMQVESMECWQRNLLCTMKRLHTGETLRFHAII
jgi:peptidoglycan hydrolase-like protein with peptidoglycan-binding domain